MLPAVKFVKTFPIPGDDPSVPPKSKQCLQCSLNDVDDCDETIDASSTPRLTHHAGDLAVLDTPDDRPAKASSGLANIFSDDLAARPDGSRPSHPDISGPPHPDASRRPHLPTTPNAPISSEFSDITQSSATVLSASSSCSNALLTSSMIAHATDSYSCIKVRQCLKRCKEPSIDEADESSGSDVTSQKVVKLRAVALTESRSCTDLHSSRGDAHAPGGKNLQLPRSEASLVDDGQPLNRESRSFSIEGSDEIALKLSPRRHHVIDQHKTPPDAARQLLRARGSLKQQQLKAFRAKPPDDVITPKKSILKRGRSPVVDVTCSAKCKKRVRFE